MKRIHVHIGNEDGTNLVCGWFDPIRTIAELQTVIERLRAAAAPTFDCSWGEQPMPIIGPSAEEMRQAVSAATEVTRPQTVFP